LATELQEKKIMTFSPMHQLHSNKTPIKSSNLRTSSIPLLVGVTKLWSPVPFRIGKVQKEQIP